MTKTIKRIAILLTLVMLAVSVQLPMVMATEANVGIMKYYVDGTQVLALPELTAGNVVKSQIKAANGDILVSAVYNGTVMQIADVGEVIPSQDGKVYETEITIPAGYDEATWDYKNFIWKDASGSMTPATEKTEAFVLSADVYVNAVVVKWDAVDGYMNETLDVYRNDVKVATVSAAQGSYVDKMIADGTTYTYQIKNADGTRISNTVSATPITAESVLNKGSWIKAGLKENGVTAADEGDMKTSGNTTNMLYYDFGEQALSNGKFYQAWRTTSDGPTLRIKGDMYPTNTLTAMNTAYTTKPEKITATDGKSAAFFLPNNVVRDKGSGNVVSNSATRVSFQINNSNGTKFNTTDTNYTVFVEHWGTRARDIKIWYSKSNTSYTWGTLNMKISSYPAINGWKVSTLDLTDANFGGNNTVNSWDNDIKVPAMSCDKNGEDLFVRRIAVLKKEDAAKVLDPSDLFIKDESEFIDHTRDEAKMEFAYDETAGTYSYDSKYMTISQFTESGNPGTNGDSSFYAGNDEDGAYQQLAPVMVDSMPRFNY